MSVATRAAVLWRLGAPPPYAGGSALTVESLALSGPEAGELLVRVEAAGLCHSDLSVINGSRPRPTPMVLGHEAAGVVEAAGPGVIDVAPGDHVVMTFVPSCGHCLECAAGRPAMCTVGAAANGAGVLVSGGTRFSRGDEEFAQHLGVSAFAERTVVSRGSVVVVPPSVPFDVAAMLGCAVLTGFGAVVNTAGVRPGESAVVFGLGGVGLSAVMAAVLAGAHPVVAVDTVPSKLSLAASLGASHVLDATADGLVDAVRDLTGGGADHAFECVGSAAVLETAFAATARGGATVAVGLPDPSHRSALPAVTLTGEGRVLRGSYMGSAAPARDIPRLIRLWEAGKLPIDRLHTADLAFDGLPAAFDELASGRAVRQLLRPSTQA
ncbi:zinc-binding dehydrogenase [Jiangella sp. DSM 45060]|uniref:zinc-binding dehydrogenase n=1 Tax=Jiangella sp. DSM 45060 TaxID=1798224 RepID=UPI00087AB21C|nr:zinc-binding dehydrogenase [Jiangella sp. DSM 45060]SDT43710.1 alcohol dehydrogenase [Jiangella sp. DSM 45060]